MTKRHRLLTLIASVFLLSLSIPLRPVEGYSGDLINAYLQYLTFGEEVKRSNVTFLSADGVANNTFMILYEVNSSNIIASLIAWDNTTNAHDSAGIYLDMNHDDGNAPNSNDFIFIIDRSGNLLDMGYNETSKSWDGNLNYTQEWTGFQYDMSISFNNSLYHVWTLMWFIPVTINDNQRMGIAVRQVDYPDILISSYPSFQSYQPNTWAEVVFLKLDSLVTISSSLASATYGQPVDLRATVNSTVSGGTITFQYKEEGGAWIDITSGTPVEGKLTCTWTPPSVGTYSIQASWSGNIVSRSSKSAPMAFITNKASSTTSTSLSTSTITYGENATVTSRITPALLEGTLTAEYSQDKTNWTEISTSTPSTGAGTFSWNPPNAGTFYIRTTWSGSKNYLNSSSTEQTLTVNKAFSSITISASPGTGQIDPLTRGGASIQVSGSITPPLQDIQVMVTYTKPDGTITTTTLTTTSEGKFTDTLSPNQPGIWSAKASWPGSINYLAAESSSVTINIGENWVPYIAITGIVAVVIVAVIALRMRKK